MPALIAMALASAVALSACSASSDTAEASGDDAYTVTHAMGETVIDGTPERVVVLDSPHLDALVALGHTPVGITESGAGTGAPPYLGDVDAEIVGLTSEPDIDAIAALAPDLIIGAKVRHEAIYDELSAKENVTFALGCYGIAGAEARKRDREALELVGLEWADRRPAKKFSGGMKRRLNLAMGIAHGPSVLLLDEPTVGIDPQARLNILDVVRGLAADGRAVLYTTHYLEEAEMLCHRVGILDHGRLLAEGTVEELRALVGEGKVATLRGEFDADEISPVVAARDDVETVSLQDGVALLSVGAGGLPRLLETLLQKGIAVDDRSIQEASLQQVFLKRTGRELRD